MSTRWETLAGDTGRFAIKMGFLEDTTSVDCQADLSASWGTLELWLNGANVCAHVEDGETVQAVHWYLLPLLEWLTTNWDPLLHEERLPIRNAGEDAVDSLYRTRFPDRRLSGADALTHDERWFSWRQRHALHAARDGGLFPEIFVRRWTDSIEVSWSNQAPVGAPSDFAFLVPHGRAVLQPGEIAEPLFEVIRAAVEQLCRWVPDSQRLDDLRSCVATLNKPRLHRAQRLDWLFDLDLNGTAATQPWDAARQLFARTSAKVRRAVLEPVGSGLVLQGSSHAVLLFGSVDPVIDIADARKLAALLIDQFDEAGDPVGLRDLLGSLSAAEPDGLPWEQGYDVAEQVHAVFEMGAGGSVDIQGVLTKIGVHLGSIELSDPRIRGVAVAGPQHRPAVFINESHPRNARAEGRRFTLAHEFCHLVIDRKVGQKLAVASGPWAPVEVEQRANAFAAYFLMPPDRVQEAIAALAVPLASAEGIVAIADAFATSQSATLEHLHNLGWLDEFERDMLRGTGLDNRWRGQELEISG